MNLRTLISAGALVTLGLLVSRALGLLREALIASSYGTGADANMIIGMLIIPDYISGTMVGGALNVVLIPAFSARNETQRRALFWHAIGLSSVVFSLLALLVYTQAESIIIALHGTIEGVPPVAMLWALFSMPLAGASGVITAWMQFHGRFAIPAFANAVFNLVVVLALWLAPSGFTVLGMAILLAGVARLILQSTGIMRHNVIAFPQKQAWQFDRRLLSHYASSVSNSFLGVMPIYAPYAIITVLSGQLALFNYAFKVVLLPVMFIQNIVNMVLLPRFVHLRKDGSVEAEYAGSLRIGLLVALSVAMSASLAAGHIMTLCFGYGEMTNDNIRQAAQLFSIGIWALPGMMIGYLWQHIFYACERPGVPFKVGFWQALASIPLIWLAQSYDGEIGVMGAYTVLQTVPVCFFSWFAHRHGIIAMRRQWLGCWGMLAASIVVYAPLAILFHRAVLSPVLGLVAAMLIGCVMLTVGLMANKEIRGWAIQRVKGLA